MKQLFHKITDDCKQLCNTSVSRFVIEKNDNVYWTEYINSIIAIQPKWKP